MLLRRHRATAPPGTEPEPTPDAPQADKPAGRSRTRKPQTPEE
ncbi:hypothetical protein PV318_03280 [Streptomyces sp. ME02-6991-2B]|nr:hypothetical protein [Streptomyces sp. ME02-6991-2B]